MKVRVTATVTYEMELDPADYDENENGSQMTDDEVIAFELSQAKNDPDSSYVLDQLRFNGDEWSNVQIDKLQETAAAAASEAA